MFPEHWEQGTGTCVECHLVKTWYEGVYLFHMFLLEMEWNMLQVLSERCFGTRPQRPRGLDGLIGDHCHAAEAE